MKAKIFAKLKQEYSPLGLGDEVLMSRAESLAATGLVTDENIDAVVAVQRSDLEAIQARTDKRVTDALEKERKKNEDDAKRKEAEAQKAAEEAAKAAEAAKKAKEEAEAEAKRKEEEAKKQNDEKAKLEAELAKLKEAGLSDTVINFLKEAQAKADVEKQQASEVRKSQDAQFESRLAKLLEESQKRNEEFEKALRSITESHTALKSDYDALKSESEASKAAKAKAERTAFILSKAKELGVPQWRIDEGFVLSDDASEQQIADALSTVANNIRTIQLPGSGQLSLPGNTEKFSVEEATALAKSIVK